MGDGCCGKTGEEGMRMHEAETQRSGKVMQVMDRYAAALMIQFQGLSSLNNITFHDFM